MTDHIFYVYEHWRPDKDVCFYVGKGHGSRANVLKKRNSHHQSIQKKLARLGMCVEVRMVANGMTERAAFDLEIERIRFWCDSGIRLTNKTTGGEGRSGAQWSAESRAKISAQTMGRKSSPETRAIQSQKAMGNTHWLGLKHSPETRAKMSAWQQSKAPASEETKRKLSEARKKRVITEETKDKLSASAKRQWALYREGRGK